MGGGFFDCGCIVWMYIGILSFWKYFGHSGVELYCIMLGGMVRIVCMSLSGMGGFFRTSSSWLTMSTVMISMSSLTTSLGQWITSGSRLSSYWVGKSCRGRF